MCLLNKKKEASNLWWLNRGRGILQSLTTICEANDGYQFGNSNILDEKRRDDRNSGSVNGIKYANGVMRERERELATGALLLPSCQFECFWLLLLRVQLFITELRGG